MEYLLSPYYVSFWGHTKMSKSCCWPEEKLTVVPCGILGAKARTEGTTHLSQDILAYIPGQRGGDI